MNERMSCGCYGTPIAQAHLELCFRTPAGATTLLFCIVPSGTYYTASYSFLMIGLGSQIDI